MNTAATTPNSARRTVPLVLAAFALTALTLPLLGCGAGAGVGAPSPPLASAPSNSADGAAVDSRGILMGDKSSRGIAIGSSRGIIVGGSRDSAPSSSLPKQTDVAEADASPAATAAPAKAATRGIIVL